MNHSQSAEALAACKAVGVPIFSGWAVRFGVAAEDGLSIGKNVLERELPEFFARGSRICEMHGSETIGRVLSTTISEHGLWIQFVNRDDAAPPRARMTCYTYPS